MAEPPILQSTLHRLHDSISPQPTPFNTPSTRRQQQWILTTIRRVAGRAGKHKLQGAADEKERGGRGPFGGGVGIRRKQKLEIEQVGNLESEKQNS
ncbi:hypothetical protein ACLOJK_036442, partial [Asimina triloba]